MTTATPTRATAPDVGADHAPVTTLNRAMLLNPYEQLQRLQAQSLARVHTPDPVLAPPACTVEELLAELALATAVQHTWQRLQPQTIHRALTAGATMWQVAAAAGVREELVAEAWLRWAWRQADHCEQLQLDDPLVTRGQIADVVARHPQLWPDGGAA